MNPPPCTCVMSDPSRQVLLPNDEAWQVRESARLAAAEIVLEQDSHLLRLLKLYIYPMYALIQALAVAGYLSMNYDKECDYPLGLWLVCQVLVNIVLAALTRRSLGPSFPELEGRLHNTRTVGKVVWFLGLWYIMGVGNGSATCDAGETEPSIPVL